MFYNELNGDWKESGCRLVQVTPLTHRVDQPNKANENLVLLFHDYNHYSTSKSIIEIIK